MEISGSRSITASRAAVWAALNDPDVLRRSIPGCQSLEPAGENAFDAVVEAIYPPEEVNPEAVRMAKLGRILRMLKILRMVRIKKLLTKLQYALGLKNGTVDIVQFFMFIAFAAHFNACAFYVRGQSTDPSSWTRSNCFSVPVTEEQWKEFFSFENEYISLTDYDEDVSISSDTSPQEYYDLLNSGSIGAHRFAFGRYAPINCEIITESCWPAEGKDW